jgi:hypothetical protein
MSDAFIDALHARLTTAGAASADRRAPDGHHTVAIARWWEEFVDVLGQKVGAWNERQAPRPPIHFTKQADGAVHLWHRSAEAAFSRDGHAVRVVTTLGTDPERRAVLTVRLGPEGNVLAMADGYELHTPAAAAEHVLTPVLMETFARP